MNFLITSIPVATIQELNKTNQLIRTMKKWKDQKFRIHALPTSTSWEMTCWADAAWANRPNGKDSTEGIFVGMSTPHLREGREADVTPLFWRSGKIERVCRSPAAAETMAGLDGEDELFYLRVLWGEMTCHVLDAKKPDECAKQTPGHLVTDAKNLFDRLNSPVLTIKGSEKRSVIEALGLRENLERANTSISWVHGDAMIANSLTKVNEKHQAFLFAQMSFRWKVVYDEKMQSAKVRKKQGIEAMEGETTAAASNNNTTYQPPQPLTTHTSTAMKLTQQPST